MSVLSITTRSAVMGVKMWCIPANAFRIPGVFTVPQFKPGAYNRLVVPAHACGSGQGRCTVIASYLGPALLCRHAENRLVVASAERAALALLN